MSTATAQAPRFLSPTELSVLVRTLREMRQWSQEQLAEIARINTRTLQRVEQGLSTGVDTRRALAGALGMEDIDAFNKPYSLPSAEELAAARERMERELVTLKVQSIESGKQLAGLAAGCDAYQFSEGVALAGQAEQTFAQLSDYCRDYGDSADLFSATDKLAVHEDLETHIADLRANGFCLVGATRSILFKSPSDSVGSRMEMLYLVVFPVGKAPDHIAVARQVQFH